VPLHQGEIAQDDRWGKQRSGTMIALHCRSWAGPVRSSGGKRVGFGIPKLLNVLAAREIEDALWILSNLAKARCRTTFWWFIRLDHWCNMVNGPFGLRVCGTPCAGAWRLWLTDLCGDRELFWASFVKETEP